MYKPNKMYLVTKEPIGAELAEFTFPVVFRVTLADGISYDVTYDEDGNRTVLIDTDTKPTEASVYVNSLNTVTTKEQDTNKIKYLTDQGNSVIFNNNLGYSSQAKVGSAGGFNVILGVENTFLNPDGGFSTLIGYNNKSTTTADSSNIIGYGNTTSGISTFILGNNNNVPVNVPSTYILGEYHDIIPQSNVPKTNACMFLIGSENKHYTGFTYSMGYNLIVRAQGEVALGMYNTDYIPVTYVKTTPDSMDRVLSVGNGFLRTGGGITRRDALTVHQNGVVLAPTVTNDLITQYPKALTTNEWVTSKIPEVSVYVNSLNTVTTKEQDTDKTKYLTEAFGSSVIFNMNHGKTGQAKVGSAGGSNVILGTENTFLNSAGGFSTLIGYNNQSLVNGNYNNFIGYGNKSDGSSNNVLGSDNLIDGNFNIAIGYDNIVYKNPNDPRGNILIGNTNTIPNFVARAILIGSEHNVTALTENTQTNAGIAAIGSRSTHYTGFSYTMGNALIVRAQGEVALGMYNTDYTPVSYVRPNPDSMDRVLSIGNGFIRIDGGITRRDALTIHQNGVMLAPTVTNDLITQYPKALTTNEWVVKKLTDSLIVPEFVKITQGSKTGYGLRYRNENPSHYGPIGTNAIDFSISIAASTVRGAVGNESMAFGNESMASSSYSIAIGSRSGATNTGSIAIGSNAQSTNSFTIAIGSGANASGMQSLAMGTSFAVGKYSVAIGRAQSNGEGSYAIGDSVKSDGLYSYTFGSNLNAPAAYSMVFGFYNLNKIGQSPDQWVVTDELFAIGNGKDGIRSNALLILKNGLAELSSVTNSLIDTNPKAIVTNEWVIEKTKNSVDSIILDGVTQVTTNKTVTLTTNQQFVVNGSGWSSKYKAINPSKYLVTGLNAVDLSIAYSDATELCGASGKDSFAAGSYTTASGLNSFAIGYASKSYVDMGVAIGYGNKLYSKFTTVVGGQGNTIGLSEELVTPTVGLNTRASIFGGQTNKIEKGDYGTIVGGGFSSITMKGVYSSTNRNSYNTIIGGYINVINDAEYSTIIGGQSNTIGRTDNIKIVNNFIFGTSNSTQGSFTTVLGYRNKAVTQGETLIGFGATIQDESLSPSEQYETARMLGVGIGYVNPSSVLVRKDGLNVYNNGLVLAPSVTNDLITQNPKALTTNEWVVEKTNQIVNEKYKVSDLTILPTLAEFILLYPNMKKGDAVYFPSIVGDIQKKIVFLGNNIYVEEIINKLT